MNRILLAGAGVLAMAVAAQAADLGRQPVYTKGPAFVPAYNWTGLYAGINGGGGWGRSSWSGVPTGGFDVSGGLIGGTIGYNWQFGQFVVGGEGDLDWANIKGSTTVNCAAGCETKNTWLGTVRGRVGYTVDRFMPYVTGGLAFGDVKASSPGSVGGSSTQTGYAVGGGLEFALAPNWTAKAEYLYVDLGEFNCGANCVAANPNNISYHSNIVRGGLNFRF